MEALLNVPTQEKKKFSLSDHLIMGVLAALVLGLCAPLRLYLPFSPVPYVMQNSLVVFFGALLGKRAALIMGITLLTQGVMGLPVFASGAIGIAAFMGPTGGYLVGYVIAAYIAGALFERRKVKTPFKLFCDLAIGSVVVWFFGMLYLSTLVGGLGKAFLLGVAPFVVTDMMKNAMLTTLYFSMTKKEKRFLHSNES